MWNHNGNLRLRGWYNLQGGMNTTAYKWFYRIPLEVLQVDTEHCPIWRGGLPSTWDTLYNVKIEVQLTGFESNDATGSEILADDAVNTVSRQSIPIQIARVEISTLHSSACAATVISAINGGLNWGITTADTPIASGTDCYEHEWYITTQWLRTQSVVSNGRLEKISDGSSAPE